MLRIVAYVLWQFGNSNPMARKTAHPNMVTLPALKNLSKKLFRRVIGIAFLDGSGTIS
jgi:hypothetical protein